jgi:hypothetical protein
MDVWGLKTEGLLPYWLMAKETAGKEIILAQDLHEGG